MNVWTERQKVENRKSDDARSESDNRLWADHSLHLLSTPPEQDADPQSRRQDFYRTRLTHSLEVAQIAAGLVKHLRKSFPFHPVTDELPEHSLIQAIGSAHDLGHRPSGMEARSR